MVEEGTEDILRMAAATHLITIFSPLNVASLLISLFILAPSSEAIARAVLRARHMPQLY